MCGVVGYVLFFLLWNIDDICLVSSYVVKSTFHKFDISATQNQLYSTLFNCETIPACKI